MKIYQRIQECCLGMLLFLLPINSSAGDARAAFDFQNEGPIQFLGFLKSHVNSAQSYVMDEAVQDWISEEDLPELISLLDSQEACMSVKRASSPNAPGRSRIGYEAAFLIGGFRTGLYPPRLNSKPVSEREKSEIRAWWAQSSGYQTHMSSDEPYLTRKRFYHSQFGHRSSPRKIGPHYQRHPYRPYRRKAQTRSQASGGY